MRATRVGRDTALARIVELVQRAQGSKAPDPAARRPDLRGVRPGGPAGRRGATFLVWFVWGPEPRLTLALTAFIGVVIIACPCAMGLATPTAIMVGTGRGAEAGILVRGGEALEAAGRIDTVVMDKTGTLTLGRPAVTRVVAVPGVDAARVLDLAASLESGSEHPLGEAIVRRAREDELGFAAVEGFEAIVGRGVAGHGRGRAGARREPAAARRARRRTVAALARGGRRDRGGRRHRGVGRRRRSRRRGSLAITDPVKAESAEAVRDAPGARASTSGCSPATRGRPPRPWRARSGSPPTASSPRCCPRTRTRSSRGSRARAGGSPWSATASTTPRRWPGRTSASPSGPARTSRSRPSDITLVGGDPRLVGVGDRAVARHAPGHPPEPVLGVRLQRAC